MIKNLLIIFSINCFCFSQFLPSDYELEKMSIKEKQSLYDKNKKKPLLATTLNIIPTLGYSYIDEWETGIVLLETKLSLLSSAYLAREQGWKTGEAIFKTFAIIMHVYEHIDVYNKTHKYYEKLYTKIFKKKNDKFSLLIFPTLNGAKLNINYKF